MMSFLSVQNRKQKEGDYDIVTGTRYAHGGGVRLGFHITVVVAATASY